MGSVRLDRRRLLALLERLSARLGAEGLRGEVLLFGGAAMVLGWNVREATRDVDAIFVPAERIRALAREIAAEEGLPETWLNDGVKGFIGRPPPKRGRAVVASFPSLEVYRPAVEYLVAMKAMAARSGPEFEDASDLRFLVREAGFSSASDVLRIVERYYPRAAVPAKVRFFVEAIFDEMDTGVSTSGATGRSRAPRR